MAFLVVCIRICVCVFAMPVISMFVAFLPVFRYILRRYAGFACNKILFHLLLGSTLNLEICTHKESEIDGKPNAARFHSNCLYIRYCLEYKFKHRRRVRGIFSDENNKNSEKDHNKSDAIAKRNRETHDEKKRKERET